MSRLRLVIADNDIDYLAKFEKFLIVNYPQRFAIISFSSAEKLYGYLDNMEPKDILLINNCMLQNGRPLPNTEVIMILTGDGGGPIQEGSIAVDKYRHTELLVTDMLRFYALRSKKAETLPGYSKTQIIGLFSPSGGSGKSSIAAGCSIISAGKGLKTLYLSLEPIPSTNLFFQGNTGQNMSNVFYHLKGPCTNLALKLEGARSCDMNTGVYFFNPPDNIAEWEEMTAENVVRLVQTLRSGSAYDVVFIDLPGGFNSRNVAILRHADRILLIQGCDPVAAAKAKAFEAGIGILEGKYDLNLAGKVITVLNRFDRNRCGPEGKILSDRPLVRIEDCLSSEKDSSTSLMGNSAFLSGLNGLLEYILKDDVQLLSECHGVFAESAAGGREYIA